LRKDDIAYALADTRKHPHPKGQTNH